MRPSRGTAFEEGKNECPPDFGRSSDLANGHTKEVRRRRGHRFARIVDRAGGRAARDRVIETNLATSSLAAMLS
jgi:hypothetical protein